MKLEVLATILTLVVSVNSYDCYNQKCEGNGICINCDQSNHNCTTDHWGFPTCEQGTSGAGVWCDNANLHCAYYGDGTAWCSGYEYDYWIWWPIGGGAVVFFIIVLCCCCCCFCRSRRRRRAMQQTVVLQQTTTPVARPTAVHNINVVGPVPPKNYGATTYPGQPGGYPMQPGGYPAQPGGYSSQPGGYLAQPGGYPAHPGGYPAQPGGYPAQPGGYPAQPGGYPAQPGGYSAQPGGYPVQPGGSQQPGNFAKQTPPYDANAPPAPLKNEYATNPNYLGP